MILKDSAMISKDRPLRVLAINPFGIGDVLFTTPVIRALSQNFPGIFIGYWCNERVGSLLKGDPRINRIFALSRGDIKKIFDESFWGGVKSALALFKELKKEKFDLAVDFSLDHRYSLVCWLAGISRRVGFDYKKRGFLLTDKVAINGYSGKHMVEYYLDLLRCIDIPLPKDNDLELRASDAGAGRINKLLARFGVASGDPVVAIAPGAGASWGRDALAKHWPPLKFAQLAEMIISELKAKVIILGDESEKPIAEIMVNAMRSKPIDLVGRTNLEELAAAIGRSRLLITNDGGPLHMAAALGVKTVSIFGPVDDLVYGPYPLSDKHAVVKKEIPCRPCYKNFRLPLCDREKECLKGISAGEVFESVKMLF